MAGRHPPAEVASVADLRAVVQEWRAAGDLVAMVPTMGALHEGHLALVDIAALAADRTVVSIFVNPTQFGPHEDYDRYPRTLDADRDLLGRRRTDLLYLPPVAEMYPPGSATSVRVAGLADDLEGTARPGHFDGVATVVAKLLIQCAPDVALFGEKDYQQLTVIRRMVRDLDLGVEVMGVPTVRAADGLALSSRNAFLTPQARRIAPALHDALVHAAQRIDTRVETPDGACQTAARRILASGFDSVDYVAARTEDTWTQPDPRQRQQIRVLGAARLAGVRLIDNVAVTTPGPRDW